MYYYLSPSTIEIKSLQVVWLEQQVIKKRSKRDFLPLQEPVEHIPRPTGSRRRRRSGSEVKGYIINNGSSSAMARRRSRRRSRRTRNSNIRITDPLWNNMWYLVSIYICIMSVLCRHNNYINKFLLAIMLYSMLYIMLYIMLYKMHSIISNIRKTLLKCR